MDERLELLKIKKQEVEEAISNVLQAGQEFQTRTGRVKMANLKVLREQLAEIEGEINDLQGSGYTDTELFVFRGCR